MLRFPRTGRNNRFPPAAIPARTRKPGAMRVQVKRENPIGETDSRRTARRARIPRTEKKEKRTRERNVGISSEAAARRETREHGGRTYSRARPPMQISAPRAGNSDGRSNECATVERRLLPGEKIRPRGTQGKAAPSQPALSTERPGALILRGATAKRASVTHPSQRRENNDKRKKRCANSAPDAQVWAIRSPGD